NAPDSSGLQKDYNTSSPSMKPVATTTGTNFGLQTKNSVKMRTIRTPFIILTCLKTDFWIYLPCYSLVVGKPMSPMNKNKITRLILLVLICYCSVSLGAADFDFRKARWGMSRAEVKATESEPPGDDTNPRLLLYKDNLDEFSVVVAYDFLDGKLTEGIYSLQDKHSNLNDHLEDYKRFKTLLTKKYGPSKENDETWSQNRYKDTPEKYGLAISLGHLKYRTTWETDRTQIAMVLKGENSEIRHLIFYKERATEKKRVEEIEKKALKKL
ncbi:MAG: hypothetical protein JWQ71_2618, partial [Pedosphaera sp.]|nr:hypothetical protein [Pedosphaera sp.]